MDGSACNLLKERIADRHELANKTQFMSRLVTGRIGFHEYVTYLRALSILYSVLETELERSDHGVIRAIWHPGMRKLPLLEEDLCALGGKSWSDLKGPITAALKGAELIRVESLANPWSLLGCLYVLEGSTNGGVLMYPRVQQALDLEADAGTRFLRNYQDDQNRIWQEFKRRLDGLVYTDGALEDVVAGARSLFDVLISILRSFDEGSPGYKIHATAINPEAGSHRVPQLDEEIQAVFLASENTCRSMPYIAARYGARGKRFTESDGAWLATLPELPASTVLNQVDWLGRFLSSIGMPRITLESHLRETEKYLVEMCPDKAKTYDKLRCAAEHLAAQRNQVIPADIQAEAAREFYNQLTGLENVEFLAEILISAKADEAIDDSSVLSDILSWLDGSDCWPVQVKLAAHELARRLELP